MAIYVLSIGNSFSQDAHRYLHDLAKSEGVDLHVANLYIAGCPLERHFRNIMGDRKEYAWEVNGHNEMGFPVSIKDALLLRSWDYITLQQASTYSFREESYQPYLNEVAAYIRKLCPKAKILLHQTWGYATGCQMIRNLGYETYEEMFADVKRCYDKAAEEIQADGIIPGGEALRRALQYVDRVHRDTFHASLGLGRFILALTWYKTITGNDVSQVNFRDFAEEITEQEYQVALKVVSRL